ncbi:transcriptional regulator ArgP [Thioclava sp. SK-1]|nr:transcriptional regulator ArgP [Thioclava sp. SK-1]
MLDYNALSALKAVLDLGSFEAASDALNVTPSAVSQRIKGLEDRMGAVLVIRGQPCTGTALGARLAQHAAQVTLMEAELLPAGAPPVLRIAVNADSLATWVMPALAQIKDRRFDLVIADQDVSAQWLRRGTVLGAITSTPTPVPGCDVMPLGALRYIACCTPEFYAQHFAQGVTASALAQAPSLMFDATDRLQAAWAAQNYGLVTALNTHRIASTHAFIDATMLGMGWALNPEVMVGQHLREGRLTALDRTSFDTPLYWQSLRHLRVPLTALVQALRNASRRVLTPP